MEFLYRLYSNNYFGIGLFVVITILAFAFLIVLFFGKKDEKAREEKKKNIEQDVLLNEESTNTKNIQSEEKVEEFVSKEEIEEEPFNFTEEEINSPLEKKESEKEATPDDLDLDFTINLSDALEEEDLFKENEKEESFTFEEKNGFEAIEEPKEEPLHAFSYDLDNNDYLERNREELNEEREDIKISEEIQNKKTTIPPVFSSVYKNNEREDEKTPSMNLNTEESVDDLENILPKKEIRIEPIVEEVKPITPKKPEFTLPKRADLPKLNKETENKNNDSIIKF